MWTAQPSYVLSAFFVSHGTRKELLENAHFCKRIIH